MNILQTLVKLANRLDLMGQVKVANEIDQMIEDQVTKEQEFLAGLRGAIEPYAKEEEIMLGPICPVCSGTGGDPENIEPWCPICYGEGFVPPKAKQVEEGDIEDESIIVNEGDIEQETPAFEEKEKDWTEE